jgi:hypothetical protein
MPNVSLSFAPEPVPGFKVESELKDGTCTLLCSGQIDAKDSSAQLQPPLLKLHDELIAAGVRQVRLDVSAVEYMNSSAIKSFMTWFLKAQRMDNPYEIAIVYDAKRTWQYVSFTTMGRIAPKVLKTIVKPAATG